MTINESTITLLATLWFHRKRICIYDARPHVKTFLNDRKLAVNVREKKFEMLFLTMKIFIVIFLFGVLHDLELISLPTHYTSEKLFGYGDGLE